MNFTPKFATLFKLLSVAAIVMGTFSASHGAIISQWTFESPNVPADQMNAATYPNPLNPAIGSGSATAVHVGTGTDWTTPAGNGSVESLSANTWAVGDYFHFQVSTLGEDDIKVYWDQNGSSTGPRDFQFSYSTDGTNFTNLGPIYSLPSGISWNQFTPDGTTTTSFSRDLSLIDAVENVPAVYFRVTQASVTSIGGAAVQAAGTGRIDNFTVVPEPSTVIFGSLASVGLGFVSMRKRNG
jgi:hypothetical protein